MSVKQRSLGSTGFQVSEIGLGAWQLGGDWGPITEDNAHSILTAAEAAGVSFWDTADVYGAGQSESFIGRYNKKFPDTQRVLVTKAGRDGSLFPDKYTFENLKKSIELSRERLDVDRIDLVQLHCIPFDELKRGSVFEWLETLKQSGLIRHYGASVETTEEALFCLEHSGVASLQIIFNLLRQDMAKDLLPQAEARDVGIIVRLGLASGLLSGHMKKDQQFSAQDHRTYNRNGEAFHVGETFSGLPFELGVELADQLKQNYCEHLSLAELSLRWLLDHSAVSSVITGASNPSQIKQNARVSNMPSLTKEQHAALHDFYISQVRAHIRGVI